MTKVWTPKWVQSNWIHHFINVYPHSKSELGMIKQNAFIRYHFNVMDGNRWSLNE